MKYLLDTHVILWALVGDNRVSPEIKEILFNKDNQLYYSTASVWEIELKHLKRKEFKLNSKQFTFLCDQNDILNLPIKNIHIDNLEEIKKIQDVEHNDPFDKMLLSQATCEGMKFITHDKKFECYDNRNIIMF